MSIEVLQILIGKTIERVEETKYSYLIYFTDGSSISIGASTDIKGCSIDNN